MAESVHVVPHTHWDREWYKPFPVFRMQLVELLDGLLEALETNPGYRHFQLDGQMAVIDDYLDIRPGNRERLASLNRSGRISMGPWYTLPDEFLVSGETHIRNLALGLNRASEMGGAMAVGYLPDMFGHIAQMPQILAGFGFSHAVVWRGVPLGAAAPAFWWEAPDGTTVRAEYLPGGYGNGAALAADGADLWRQIDTFRTTHGSLVGQNVLWMHGTDHQLPDPRLVEVVTQAQATAPAGSTVEITSLATHLAEGPTENLPRWRGELRSGARANLLMGVASCRTDVKQAAARAERWLEKLAEPLLACWMPAADWPGEFLAGAWREMIRNAAHDSICGCSTDEVNATVLHRYSEASRVAEALTDRALIRALAASRQPMIVVNPSRRERSGVVRVVIDGDEAPAHCQQVSVRPAVETGPTLPASAALAVVMRAATDDPRISRVTLLDQGGGAWTARLHADRRPPELDLGALWDHLNTIAADPASTVTIETHRRHATQEVLVATPNVSGYSWRGLAPADLDDHTVRAVPDGLTNGLVTVTVDADTGTFNIDELTGLGRIEEDGDAGDTYNWSPTIENRTRHQPARVEVSTSESGPVRGRIVVQRWYRWPTHAEDGHRVGESMTQVTTRLELRAGEDLVRVRISFDHHSRDHRVRVVFPLAHPATTSRAGCAFTTVERGLTTEGGPNEQATPTFPCREFVSVGGLTVAHEGLPEYEVLTDPDTPEVGTALAVTLLRAVGVISQGPMTARALPAGPSTPVPAAQMAGPFVADLVVHKGERNPYEIAEDAFTPLLTARMPGAGWGDPAATHQVLAVTGAEVSALTRRPDGRRELRVFNPTDQPSVLVVAGLQGELTDLRGTPTGERFDGTTPLGPHQILTVALDDR